MRCDEMPNAMVADPFEESERRQAGKSEGRKNEALEWELTERQVSS